MHRSFKYRLCPNRIQRERMITALGLTRELYNLALEQRRGQRVGVYEQARQLTVLRAGCPEHAAVPSRIQMNVLWRLNEAFAAFFRRVKDGDRPGYPRFKSADRWDSLDYGHDAFRLDGERLKLPKIGNIRIRLSRPTQGKVKTCIIKRSGGQWYAVLVCEVNPSPLTPSKRAVGIDVGIEHFAMLSNGTAIPNPRFFERDQKAIRKASRKVARRKRSSHRRKKAVLLLRRLHERIGNRRRDFLHKQSTALIQKYGLIAIENLNVSGLAKGKLAKQVHDASWATFFSMLSYKAEGAGRELVEVDSRYTSQTCPSCGNRKKKPLSERQHNCLVCGYAAHRDTAAAQIVLARAWPSGANLTEVIV